VGITVDVELFDAPDAARLRAELERELIERYGADVEPGAKPTAAETSVFLVARDERGEAVGCGALTADGEVGELKRMFVRPGARGRGIAGALLARLEDEARARGFRLLRLETGSLQPEARALYERAGYREIPCFGAYAGAPHSRCYERRLDG
jgi:putative acetyltransferase